MTLFLFYLYKTACKHYMVIPLVINAGAVLYLAACAG